LIREFNVRTFVEVGAESGKLSWLILNECDDVYTYLVDISFEACDLNAFRQFGMRFSILGMRSVDASFCVSFETCPLDMVYIDAGHSYLDVNEDLRAWYPRVRQGGVVAGHDYGHPNWPGVKQAVDEFVQKKGKKLNVGEYFNFWFVK